MNTVREHADRDNLIHARAQHDAPSLTVALVMLDRYLEPVGLALSRQMQEDGWARMEDVLAFALRCFAALECGDAVLPAPPRTSQTQRLLALRTLLRHRPKGGDGRNSVALLHKRAALRVAGLGQQRRINDGEERKRGAPEHRRHRQHLHLRRRQQG